MMLNKLQAEFIYRVITDTPAKLIKAKDKKKILKSINENGIVFKESLIR